MITTLDDYPIHQAAQPVAVPATSDRNFYDRFWFSGFVGDGSLYFAVAMGFYPNRRVQDAAFSVLVDGHQYSLHISGDLPLDRAKTEIGPLKIDTVIPMRRHRVTVNDPARGFEADLTFEGGTGTHEEARQIMTDGVQLSMDVTRMTQFGTWSGWIVVKGKRIEVDGRVTNGTRDRSWGVRPCGESSGRPSRWAAQLYFGWTQTFWDDHVLHGVLYQDGKGDTLMASGGTIPRVPKADTPVFARDTGEAHATPYNVKFNYLPGTRRIRDASIDFRLDDGETHHVTYEPLATFQMTGVGYFHPEWGHGFWKGSYAIADETWVESEIDLTKPQFFHVQQVCKVTRNGKSVASGILEHCAFGPHATSGFTDLVDVFQP